MGKEDHAARPPNPPAKISLNLKATVERDPPSALVFTRTNGLHPEASFTKSFEPWGFGILSENDSFAIVGPSFRGAILRYHEDRRRALAHCRGEDKAEEAIEMMGPVACGGHSPRRTPTRLLHSVVPSDG